ncbi:MAG: flagellar biosynthetic protein FliO [Planctomycetota bacterium]
MEGRPIADLKPRIVYASSRAHRLGGVAVLLCLSFATPAWADSGASAEAQQRLDRMGARFEGSAPTAQSGPERSATPGVLPHPADRKPLGAATDVTGPAASKPSRLEEAVDPAETSPLGVSSGVAGGLLNTLGALGVVIAAILVARWFLTKRLGLGSPVGPSPSVEVLSRTAIAPKSHVLLLRVGPRVLVVSDSSAGARTLSEVDDPEEVAQLLESVHASQSKSFAGGFRSALAKIQQQADDTDPRAVGLIDAEAAEARKPSRHGRREAEPAVDRARDLISSLSSRFRATSATNRGAP